VRKLILTATCCTCLAGAAWFLNPVEGQDSKTPRKEAAAEELPHKIALIDMTYIFKNYEKLKYRETELKAEFEDLRGELEKKRKKGLDMEAELKDYKQDSPEFDAKKQKLDKLAQDLQFDTKQVQIKMQKEQARMTLEIYHEVHDVVERFCKQYNYTLVLQFSRSEVNSTDPQRLMQVINQPVVYYRKTESGKCKDDLSEPVVKHLNREYVKNSGSEEGIPAANSKKPKKDENVKQAQDLQSPSGSSKRVRPAAE